MIINQFPFVYGGNNNGRTYKSNALHGRTARSASRRNRGERRGIAPLAHTATVELSPEWSQPDEVIDYTFKITNEADSDPIQQVWIYKNPLYEDFVCDPITGWNLNYHNVYQPGTNQIVTDACQWVAQAGLTDGFDDDTSKDFTFTAKTPAGAGDVCELKWYVQTVDTYPGEIGGDANMNHGFTSIDVTPPVITTELFGTNVTHNGDLYVHPSDSYVEITANDVADVDCQSGIDYCDWTLYRNGEVEDSGTEYGSGEPSITWNVYFDRDSDHELVVDCWDVAGNQADQVT